MMGPLERYGKVADRASTGRSFGVQGAVALKSGEE